MTLIFLLTYSPESGESFSYPQHVSKVISHHFTAIWSKNFRKKCSKSHFCGWRKNEFRSWLSDIFHFSAVFLRYFLKFSLDETTLEKCWGYEKDSPDSGLYVSKKIRVVRRVEMKISQEKCKKLKSGLKNCSRDTFWILPKVTFWLVSSKTFASNGRRTVGNHFKNMF